MSKNLPGPSAIGCGTAIPRATTLDLLRVDPQIEQQQAERVRSRKAAREAARVRAALAEVRDAAEHNTNLMPPLIDAVKQGCSVGEISDVYREVFGVYRDPMWL